MTGLNDSDYVSHSATAGTFDPDTGIWSIGELHAKDFIYVANGRDGEVLTIITGADSDTEITAAISNPQDDYRVCIDSEGNDVDAASEMACTGTSGNTWHTTSYYDHISDNNSATVMAREGNGADLPTIRSVEWAGNGAIEITWEALADVNGRSVTHYEVQKRTNPWMTVARTLETTWVDTDVEEGEDHQYRVRGMNDRGQQGPWSPPGTTASLPPMFPGDTAVRTVAENTASGEEIGAPVEVSDPGDDTLTYTLSGTDAISFDIATDTGQLLTKTALDHETQSSYEVTVSVTDGLDEDGNPDASIDDTIAVTIEVENVDEPGMVTLSSAEPEVGIGLTAELTDPDEDVQDLTWVWERSPDQSVWTTIAGAESEVYTPVAADLNHHLRATASYDDGEGAGKSAEATTDAAVQDFPNRPPVVISQIPDLTPNSMSVEIDLSERFSDPDDDDLVYTVSVTNERAATASVDGDTLTIAMVAPGRTRIIVTAHDGDPSSDETLSVEQTFRVVVPRVVTIEASEETVTEGRSVNFTLRINFAPTESVGVRLRISEDGSFISQLQRPPSSVVIPAGATSASFLVSLPGDDVDEPHGSVTVEVRGGHGYVVGSPSSATVTVIDDD